MNARLDTPVTPAVAHLRSLATELDTDWAPDPWSYVDIDPLDTTALMPGVNSINASFLVVPFLGGRARRVVLLDVAARLQLQRTAVALVASVQDHLAEGVFPYRVGDDGEFAHYREAAAKRRRYEFAVGSQYPFVATTDVVSFFPAVSYDLMKEVVHSLGAPLQPRDSEFLRAVTAVNGYPLLEGYAAARALANTVLISVDEAIDRPFTRWIDDYNIFVETDEEGRSQVESVRSAAGALGLLLAKEKTTVQPLGVFQCSQAVTSLESHDDVNALGLEALALPEEWSQRQVERFFRLRFRIAAETGQNEILAAAWDIRDRLPPSVLPRMAAALALTSWSSVSARLVEHFWGIEDPFTTWRRLRLAYVLWYAPREFVLERFDIWLSAFSTDSPVAPPLGRSLARHLGANSTLDEVCANLPDRRAAGLIAAEARGHADPAVCKPPPVHSYL
jgi:hypothetical protein